MAKKERSKNQESRLLSSPPERDVNSQCRILFFLHRMRIFINSEARYRIKEKKKNRRKKLVLIERTAWGSAMGIE